MYLLAIRTIQNIFFSVAEAVFLKKMVLERQFFVNIPSKYTKVDSINRYKIVYFSKENIFVKLCLH